MKVRVGYGLGNLRPLDGERLGALAEGIERHGFDSLWLSERISGPAPDPVLGLTYAAAAARRRSSSARASRCSPAAAPRSSPRSGRRSTCSRADARCPRSGSASRIPVEQQAFGVARGDRASIFDEALPLLRRLWTEDSVDHDGTWFHYEGMSVLPKPAHPLDVWLGGKAPSELRRVGRLGDGWLASFATPEQCAAAASPIIEDAAAACRPRDRPRALRRHGLLHARRAARPAACRCSRRATPTSTRATSSRAAGPRCASTASATSRSASRSSCSSRSRNRRTGTTSSRPGAAEILPLQT